MVKFDPYSGVYSIISISKPSRRYVGSAVDIEKRWKQHRFQLRNGVHHSKKLQRHYDKYGPNDLRFQVTATCSIGDLIQREQFWIDFYNPYFNSRPKANSQLGFRHSEETKKKISEIKKGCDHWTGRKHSPEAKEKMRIAKLGRKLSIETRNKLSIARLGNRNAAGNKNRLGIGFSDESKRKISNSLKKYFANRSNVL